MISLLFLQDGIDFLQLIWRDGDTSRHLPASIVNWRGGEMRSEFSRKATRRESAKRAGRSLMSSLRRLVAKSVRTPPVFEATPHTFRDEIKRAPRGRQSPERSNQRHIRGVPWLQIVIARVPVFVNVVHTHGRPSREVMWLSLTLLTSTLSLSLIIWRHPGTSHMPGLVMASTSING